MKEILCFFGNISGFLKRYKQYPEENSYIYPDGGSYIFRKLFYFSSSSINGNKRKKEQLMVYREKDFFYYAYVHKLDNGRSIGIGIISEKICPQFDNLFDEFRLIVNKMANPEQNNRELILKKKKKKLVTTGQSFLDRHVDLDIFIRELEENIEQCFNDGKKPPLRSKLGINEKDVVYCSLCYSTSEWIVQQIEMGYHQVCIIPKEWADSTKYYDFVKKKI